MCQHVIGSSVELQLLIKDLSDKLIFVNLHKQISSLSISGILSQVHTSSSNAEVLRASIFKASGK